MTEEQKLSWRQWFKAASIRAVKTWAQAGVAFLGAGAIGVFDVDWVGFVSVSLMAAVLSILTSLAGLPEADSPVRGD